MNIEYYYIATLNSEYQILLYCNWLAFDDNYYNRQSNKKKRIYIYDTRNKHIWCRINIINISKNILKN